MDKTSSATNVSKGKSNSKIEKLIYTIRGQQVMLDSDLAKLYQCKNGTKTINQAVRRNRDRFPEDFCFQLSKADFEYLKSQVGTSRLGSKHGGVRKMPVVFTEQGVAMLSSVLRTEVAVEASINIMRAFVLLKKYAPNNFIEQKYYNAMVVRHENEIELLNV